MRTVCIHVFYFNWTFDWEKEGPKPFEEVKGMLDRIAGRYGLPYTDVTVRYIEYYREHGMGYPKGKVSSLEYDEYEKYEKSKQWKYQRKSNQEKLRQYWDRYWVDGLSLLHVPPGWKDISRDAKLNVVIHFFPSVGPFCYFFVRVESEYCGGIGLKEEVRWLMGELEGLGARVKYGASYPYDGNWLMGNSMPLGLFYEGTKRKNTPEDNELAEIMWKNRGRLGEGIWYVFAGNVWDEGYFKGKKGEVVERIRGKVEGVEIEEWDGRVWVGLPMKVEEWPENGLMYRRMQREVRDVLWEYGMLLAPEMRKYT